MGLVWSLASFGFDWVWFRSLASSGLFDLALRLGFCRPCLCLFKVGLGLDFFGLRRLGFRIQDSFL